MPKYPDPRQKEKIRAVCESNPDLSDRAIADMIGVSRTAIWKYRNSTGSHRRRPSPKLDVDRQLDILGCLQGGMTFKQIAAKCKCSCSSVAYVAAQAEMGKRERYKQRGDAR
jgi:DNA-binding NarL/FixJ family response regulator